MRCAGHARAPYADLTRPPSPDRARKQGAKYAEEQYEKYNTGYNGATKTYNTIRASTAAERQDLLDERNLIKQIMVMIGASSDLTRLPPSLSLTLTYWIRARRKGLKFESRTRNNMHATNTCLHGGPGLGLGVWCLGYPPKPPTWASGVAA